RGLLLWPLVGPTRATARRVSVSSTEATSDQPASVSSDRRAQVMIPRPPIRTLGRESQRTLDIRIRLVPWGASKPEAMLDDEPQFTATGPLAASGPGRGDGSGDRSIQEVRRLLVRSRPGFVEEPVDPAAGRQGVGVLRVVVDGKARPDRALVRRGR